jgi:hypothetical protein
MERDMTGEPVPGNADAHPSLNDGKQTAAPDGQGGKAGMIHVFAPGNAGFDIIFPAHTLI